ncbi:DNA replication factor Cdt1-like [Argopecten irradians]|uniref:DNA replication factor Cdt1-like n=1 Tax=Argopecten irradians TaxID=31199 RepID=UPI003712FAB7
MAQARVTEFFSARKRTAESQPSKRRKVVILSSNSETLPVQNENVRSTRASSRNKAVTDPVPDQFTFNANAEPLAQKSIDKSKSEKKSKTKSVRRVRKANVKSPETNQSSIKDAFEKASRASTPTEDIENTGTVEEVTSAWDEHDGVPLTPSKRPKDGDNSSDSERTEATKKRTRRGKSKAKETEAVATPSKVEIVETTRKPRQAKKNLHLRPVIYSSSEEGSSENEVTEETSPMSVPPKTPPAISPIPETPEVVRQQLKKGPAKPTSSKVKAAMALVQKLQNSKGKAETKTTYKNDLKETMTSESMKDKLSKVGGLDDLKARLADMKKTKASLKKDVPKLKKFDKVDVEVPDVPKETTKKAPAYERFHALATPAPPTLTMPYKYRLLGDVFRSMDTVVSMLHNRTEACTFSKLKAAVQSMTKRNFEEKHVGQVKTVYPTAYTFRQQKGIPDFTSNKPAGWQLTLEANLDQDDMKQKKTNFSPKDLMDRRCVFQNKMLSIVKRHHKEFLAKLDKPLTIPDDKITRWHPKFSVDEVPDIEVSELPKPEVTHKYTTARDVLEAQRGQLPIKVEQALENVALTSKESIKQEVKAETKADTGSASNNTQYKGIPQSLLDKIRAKENKKLTLAMTRNPAEDKRMEMLRRLPELMRMLRSHFVTEKKPALLLENIIQKLGDSSRNFIPYASVESHVKLMIEVLPKWLTLIEIKKGKYVKMDRNLDLQVLVGEVNNLVKNKG